MIYFEMLVGLPASGKSTYTKQKEAEGWKVFSSDEIRKEFNIIGQEKEDHARVFQILHERLLKALKNGENCIYDATNLSQKRRKAFIDQIDSSVYKTCVLFITTIDTCKEWNSKREGVARVPDEVYDKMLKNFNVPYYYEGWNNIKIVKNTDFRMSSFLSSIGTDPLESFNQENSHHSLSLGEHLNKTVAYAKSHWPTNKNVQLAAGVHDIGKYFTKTFYNMKGEKTEEAHYYGHENYGTYIFLQGFISKIDEINKIILDNDLYIACLINWHMRPYTAWENSEKSRDRDRRLIGEKMYLDVMRLHEADMAAH